MRMNKKAIENAIKNNRSKVDGFVVSPDDAEHIKVCSGSEAGARQKN